jgi:hypothetical protein
VLKILITQGLTNRYVYPENPGQLLTARNASLPCARDNLAMMIGIRSTLTASMPSSMLQNGVVLHPSNPAIAVVHFPH